MLRARFYSAFFFLAAIACGDTKSPTAAPDAGRAEVSAALVPAGGSIQSAIDAAARWRAENGVKRDHVKGFVRWNVRGENDGEYGLFPVFSSHGVIVHCAASGHSDTGIYVGQCDHIVVVDNVASGNVNGLEIENSSDVLVANNESFDNVAGILVVLLPGLDVKTSSTILVRGNRVHDNNHPNFGTPGELESFVPTGSGILIVGTDA